MIKTTGELDKQYVWHPYSQHGMISDFMPVCSARGSYIELENGTQVIDAISSWWVNIHGHGHPKIVQTISEQAKNLDHVIFAGFTHSPAAKLAQFLIDASKTAGAKTTRAFFSDNGSTAVEVALKMAFQFHYNSGNKNRTRFIALRGSYHGDTLGTMAVGEPDGFHALFRPLLPQVDFVEPGDLDSFKKLLHEKSDSIAAFIFEPLLQGASGMRTYSANFLKEAAALCQENKILTIADEVFTAFFRTGKMFAFEHAKINPDFICLSKGITGGTLPLAVTLATEPIYEAFLGMDLRSAFLHGHSYTGNPIACAAALASWELLTSEHCQQQIRAIKSQTEKLLSQFSNEKKVKDIRNLGTIGAIELNSNAEYMNVDSVRVMRFAIERGVLLRPLGRVLYAVPPYCLNEQELKKTYDVIGEAIHEFF